MDRAAGAMMGGGGVGVIAANSEKIHSAVNSEAVVGAVNFLHYPLFQIGDAYIAPNTICTLLGISLGLYGFYKNHKSKNDKDD